MRYICVMALFAAGCGWGQTVPPKTQPQPVTPVTPQKFAAPKAPATPAVTPPKPPDANEVQSQMAQSLAKQRVAAMQQVTSAMGKPPTPAPSFFTVPWVEPPVPFSQPPCDPLPAAEAHTLLRRAASATSGTRTQRLRTLIG